MNGVGIEISAETMERVQTLLANIPKGAERAYMNAINRGLSRVKTAAWQGIKQVYTVQAAALNAATNTRIQKAGTGNLAGFVRFAGYKIPLYKFKVSPKQPGGKKLVRASVKKGGGAVFESAFIAAMKSGHVGVFERTGEQGIAGRLAKTKTPGGTMHTEKLEEKMGLSAAQMAGQEAVSRQVQEEAQRLVNERLEHEIDRLLNGYGG